MTWDDEVAEEVMKYRGRISEYARLIAASKDITIIVDSVLTDAANLSLNAGYSGSHNDNGAGANVEMLKAFLSGCNFATGGNAGKYQDILDEHVKTTDPEWVKYQELKKKFEGQ